MYGTILKLSGEYFTSEDPIGYSQMFAEKLRERIRQARELDTAHHTKIKTFMHKDLEDATHLFIRVDCSKGPLKLSYKGPFRIMKRISDFLYKVDYKEQPEEINIVRLKLAFLERVEDQEEKPSSINADNQELGLSETTLDQHKEQRKQKIQFVNRSLSHSHREGVMWRLAGPKSLDEFVHSSETRQHKKVTPASLQRRIRLVKETS